jgi:hypothetical protein
MSNGSWKLLSAFNDNYNLVLDTRNPDDARQEVIERLTEIKQQWTPEQIISLENLLTIGRQNLLSTEINESSPAPTANKT